MDVETRRTVSVPLRQAVWEVLVKTRVMVIARIVLPLGRFPRCRDVLCSTQ